MVDNSPALIISQICSTRFSLQAIVHLPSGMHIKSSTKLKRFFIFRHPDFGVVALMLGRTPNRGKFRGQLLHQPSPAITSHHQPYWEFQVWDRDLPLPGNLELLCHLATRIAGCSSPVGALWSSFDASSPGSVHCKRATRECLKQQKHCRIWSHFGFSSKFTALCIWPVCLRHEVQKAGTIPSLQKHGARLSHRV